mgnify:CR=1 FL=1
MPQVEILRHAIDAARAGNPEVARVHLQKAAEIVPDDPAVWLWLSWLSDSPVSMIQCLELVRRHNDYREIAEAGLAFARGLARFDCDALLPEAPEGRGADNDRASENARSADETEEVPGADETIAATESDDEFESETTAEIATPSDETDSPADSLAEAEVEGPALESDNTQETVDGESAADQPPVEVTESEETATLDNLDDIDEEFEAAASSLWDGIALLSRTADAVADELKADSEFDGDDAVGSEETAIIDLKPNQVDPDASPPGEQAKAGSDPDASEEGNSWFDYWLPEDERAAKSTSLDDNAADQIPEESAATPGPLSAEVAEAEVDPHEESCVSENKVVLEEVQDKSPSQVTVNEPAEDSGNSLTGEVEYKPAVLEIVDDNPFESPSTNDEQQQVTAEAEHSDAAEAEFGAETAGGYVPPVAQTVFDIPVALQGDADPLPRAPGDEDESDDEEAMAGWSAPTPAHQSEDVWRAAQSDWFSVGHQQKSEALIPHENPLSEPPAASGGPSNPAAISPQASTLTTPAQPEVRAANQSIFDAEPTPPAVIPASQPLSGPSTMPKTSDTSITTDSRAPT